ncbi:MAG: EAL domain-containing protein [Cyanobacteriota bacterium]|nr:EAL domain-containing protein [Cyanobacteriota bacterium]
MTRPLRVLIVEDSEDDVELLICELELGGYDPIYRRVDTAETTLAALEEREWDLIVADYSMPQFNATAALSLLQEKGLDLPFIIVSGTITEDTAVAAMKAGVHDYLTKDNLARLVPAVERELREALVRKEHRRVLERLKYQAFYDDLTGLPNRTFFLERVGECIEAKNQNPLYEFAVLFLDLDRYQVVKYSLGHLISEELLVATGELLKSCLGPKDVLARMGADEFAILLRDIKEPGDGEKMAETIHRTLSSPFKLNGPVVFSTTSIGIVSASLGCLEPEEFLRVADTAMHYAKVRGIGGTAVFNKDMQAGAVERWQLETDLQEGIKCRQFYLNYQPIVCLATGRLMGFEALVRWRHPTRGLVSPGEFIPLAEETGLIVPLGEWVLEEACRRLAVWQEQFPHFSSLSLSVNLSGIQLKQLDIIEKIDTICQDAGVSGDRLKLEVTESVLMENAVAARAVLEKLQARLIRVSLDDFGTGYSSLSYLHRLPINTLKIDRSFVSNLELDDKNFNIVKAIISLAHSLGLDVIAEGVETPEQVELLRSLACEYGQGYYFSRPLDDDAAMDFLTKKYLFERKNSKVEQLENFRSLKLKIRN